MPDAKYMNVGSGAQVQTLLFAGAKNKNEKQGKEPLLRERVFKVCLCLVGEDWGDLCLVQWAGVVQFRGASLSCAQSPLVHALVSTTARPSAPPPFQPTCRCLTWTA